MTKTILITGATGNVGRPLSQALLERGYQIVVFTRSPDRAPEKVPGAQDYVQWDASLSGPWASAIDGVHGVINLAGESLFDGYLTEEKLIRAGKGRVIGTRGLVNAISQAAVKPKVLVNASATGIYGFTEVSDTEITEEAPAPRLDHWSKDTERWEIEAYRAEQDKVRVAALRIGVALERDAGMLEAQVGQFRAGYGGAVAPGNQWMPWIHIDDIVGLLIHLLEHDIHGPVNGVSPGVVRQIEYAQTLAEVLGVTLGPMVSAEQLEQHMGLGAQATTHMRHVIPQRALATGYQFRHPQLKEAMRDLLNL